MRSVLITGGTGSFGQAFVKAALQTDIERVCVYSRDELKQAEMRSVLPDSRLRWFIGDVRDQARLRRALEGCDTVIHAAALKRVEVGEFDAPEMVKTNILGTMNLIEAATDAMLQRVIVLSTDKASVPISAYGATKLLMERLIACAQNARGLNGPRFATVRCGNFAGSRGSIIPTWRQMLSSGLKNLPVTDKRCTRFIMRIEEAVSEVLDLEREMNGGELVMPHLRAFRVVDLAEAMGSGWHEVGLRPGERLHEHMDAGISSEDADMLSVDELRTLCSAIA